VCVCVCIHASNLTSFCRIFFKKLFSKQITGKIHVIIDYYSEQSISSNLFLTKIIKIICLVLRFSYVFTISFTFCVQFLFILFLT
jgi:hypothetical protein